MSAQHSILSQFWLPLFPALSLPQFYHDRCEVSYQILLPLPLPQFALHLFAQEFIVAHPYHSWERGLNENTNGLIRQYIPKGSDFNVVSQIQIDQIVNRLNSRPRKSLNYATPNEIFR